MGQIISISVNKNFRGGTATVVSYGDIDYSMGMQLLSIIEENGIYTKTYAVTYTKDLEKKVEMELEDYVIDFYVKGLYMRLFKRDGAVSYIKRRFIGNSSVQVSSISGPSGAITLSDIVKHPITGIEKRIRQDVSISYGRNMIASVGMCSGSRTEQESSFKRISTQDYTLFPKINYKYCLKQKKSISLSLSNIGITVEYVINMSCNVHYISKVNIVKNVIKKYLG